GGATRKRRPAGEFKAGCLGVMEEVRKYRVPVLITKKGRPVAKLVPADPPSTDVFGCMADTVRIVGDVEAPVASPADWTAVGGGGSTRARRKRVPGRRQGRRRQPAP